MKFVLRSCALVVCLLVSQLASAALLCPFTAPVIDGVIAPGEWDSAAAMDIQVHVPGGATAPARLYFMNDEKFLYLALRVRRDKADFKSTWQVTLDADRSGGTSAGDDVLMVVHNYTDPDLNYDGVDFVGGSCQPNVMCNDSDTNFGGRNDVTGAVSGDGTYVMFELSKPLAAQDAVDADMPPGSSIGIRFVLQLLTGIPGGYGTTIWPNDLTFVPYAIKDCTYWR